MQDSLATARKQNLIMPSLTLQISCMQCMIRIQRVHMHTLLRMGTTRFTTNLILVNDALSIIIIASLEDLVIIIDCN